MMVLYNMDHTELLIMSPGEIKLLTDAPVVRMAGKISSLRPTALRMRRAKRKIIWLIITVATCGWCCRL